MYVIKLIIGIFLVKFFLYVKKVINVRFCSISNSVNMIFRLENIICKYDVGFIFIKVVNKINIM